MDLYTAASWFLILFGLALIADKVYLHLITFNYSALGISWLDPYMGHGLWGILFVALGAFYLGRRR